MKYSAASWRWFGSISVLMFMCPPQPAEACTCAPYPDDLEKAVTMAYAHGSGIFQVDFIFLGEVTAIRNRANRSLPQYEVTFSVRDRWKGSIPDMVSVRTNNGEIACGYKFEKRNGYLVFAHWDEQGQELVTSWCDLTRTEAKAKDAIGVLNRLRKRAQAAARHNGGGTVNDRFAAATSTGGHLGEQAFSVHELGEELVKLAEKTESGDEDAKRTNCSSGDETTGKIRAANDQEEHRQSEHYQGDGHDDRGDHVAE